MYQNRQFKKIENKLSKQFYFKNFPKIENNEYLELNDDIKKELIDLLNEYKVDFSIAIRDRLLVIEIHFDSFKLLKNTQKVIEIKELVSGLLNVFVKIEETNS